jgi:hypothetical protein
MSVLVDVDISQWKLHGKSVGYIRKVTSWTRAHFKAKQNVTGFVTEFLSDFLSSSLEERCWWFVLSSLDYFTLLTWTNEHEWHHYVGHIGKSGSRKGSNNKHVCHFWCFNWSTPSWCATCFSLLLPFSQLNKKIWSILHGHVIVQITFCVSLFPLFGSLLSWIGSTLWSMVDTHPLMVQKAPHCDACCNSKWIAIS